VIGDKVIPKAHHRKAAKQIHAILRERVRESRTAVTIAGESGSGKSETALELKRCFENDGHIVHILQQDDYFYLPPKTNEQARRRDIQHVGLKEVNLELLDEHVASFKDPARSTIEKPLVIFQEDRITRETVDLHSVDILIAEGTYTTILSHADSRIFIDRSYKETLEHRKDRARDQLDAFIERVLEIEHEIISKQKSRAQIIVNSDYSATEVTGSPGA
jgi:uridine kinase